MDSAAPCPDFARLLRERPADEEVREQLAACLSHEAHRVARFRCGNPAQAEDAAQAALLAALESLGAYRGDAPIEAWLRRIVVSACHRLRRGRKNDPGFNLPLDETVAAGASAATPAPQEDAAILGERLALLRAALAAVPAASLTLLLEHETDDVPIADLARRHGTTVDAVKSRLKRTRRALRDEVLRRAGGPPGA
jgi:RNA polymerase sigma-70 factor (ECF subfamily)